MAKQPDTRESEYRHDHLDDDDLERILRRDFDLSDWFLMSAAVVGVAVVLVAIWHVAT